MIDAVLMQGYKHAPAATSTSNVLQAIYCLSNNCRQATAGDPRTSHSGNTRQECCTGVPADYDLHVHLSSIVSFVSCNPCLAAFLLRQ